jgi:hypothetical protein
VVCVECVCGIPDDGDTKTTVFILGGGEVQAELIGESLEAVCVCVCVCERERVIEGSMCIFIHTYRLHLHIHTHTLYLS